MRLAVALVLVFSAPVAIGSVLAACATGGPTDNLPVEPTGSSSGGGMNDATVGSDSTMSNYGDGATTPTGNDTGAAGTDTGSSTDTGSGDDASDAGPAGVTCAAGETCVDAVPSGWSGYVQLLLGDADGGGDAGPGSCAPPYGVVQNAGSADPTGDPAGCGACNCGVPDSGPVQCSVGVGTLNVLCVPPTGFPTTPVGQSCVMVANANGSAGGVSVTSTGACGTQPGRVTTPPPPPRATPAAVCAPVSADAGAPDAGANDAALVDAAGSGDAGSMVCAASQACALLPQSKTVVSGSHVCIYQAGVQTCPPGLAFSDLHVLGGSLNDGRGCSCFCADPTCPSDGYVAGYRSTDCTGDAATTFNANAACTAFGNANMSQSFIYHPSRGTWTGACAVADAGPSGSVTVDPASAVTLCCVP
jgi:hypothetical protein